MSDVAAWLVVGIVLLLIFGVAVGQAVRDMLGRGEDREVRDDE